MTVFRNGTVPRQLQTMSNACTGQLVPVRVFARYWHSTAPVPRVEKFHGSLLFDMALV